MTTYNHSDVGSGIEIVSHPSTSPNAKETKTWRDNDNRDGTSRKKSHKKELYMWSLKGLVDYLYLFVFFGGSSAASTLSLLNFQPKELTKKSQPAGAYLMSFLSGAHCDSWELLAGHDDLNRIRQNLTFFNANYTGYIFDDADCGTTEFFDSTEESIDDSGYWEDYYNPPERCLGSGKDIDELMDLDRTDPNFNLTTNDKKLLNLIGCVKDWNRESSNERGRTVLEIYIISLLLHIFLVVDMSWQIQKKFWKNFYNVSFSVSFIVEFVFFMIYSYAVDQEEELFDKLSWQYVGFRDALSCDENIEPFLNRVMVCRFVGIVFVLTAVLFGKTRNSTEESSSSINLRKWQDMLYYFIVLVLSTLVCCYALFSYHHSAEIQDIEGSNFIGGDCKLDNGDSILGLFFSQLYPDGWETSESFGNWKAVDCIDMTIYTSFTDFTNMFIVAYTAGLLFYVYLLHFFRHEFTQKYTWYAFRLLFIVAFVAEISFWINFQLHYSDLKHVRMMTSNVYPDRDIIKPFTFEVTCSRMGIISCYFLTNFLQDCCTWRRSMTERLSTKNIEMVSDDRF